MPTCRQATIAICSSLFAVATAQAPLPLPVQLLLPSAPTIGRLRFEADGSASLRRPEAIDAFADLSPLHQHMLLTLTGRGPDETVVHGCWLKPVSPAVAALFNAAIQGPAGFQPATRWSGTATQGGGLGLGDPTTLTFSFIPDGTSIPNGVGEGPGTSNLFASFGAVFPNQATWQNRMIAAFQLWGDLTGNTYIYEPNDDGAPLFNSSGQLGVRGDVRIGGKFVDGGSGILAYNMYPNGGDMVIDTGDSSYFSNPANNYRRLFNVTGHEHGHGLGIDHVCPADDTKLMEPYLSTVFNGPQFDDILSAQRLYGDRLEPNDNYLTPTNLGAIPNGVTNVTNVSIDGVADQDYFRFDVPSDKLLTVTLHPTGSTYLEGPQVGNCTSGSQFNPAILRNLGLIVFNGTATSILATATAQPAGVDEVVSNLALTAGSYLLRVSGNAFDTIQMYQLTINIVDNGTVAAATPFGTSCGGLNWNPLTRPILGTTQIVLMNNIPNPTSSILLVLLGYNAIPGGLDLGFLGAPGCDLNIDAVATQAAFPATPTYLWLLPIPSTIALSGSSLFTQGALLVPPGTNPFGALTTNGVELLLGTQ